MPNPITQADVGSTLSQHYDTQGQQMGSPGAEIEADRILLTHEMGTVMFGEKVRVRIRRLACLALNQSSTGEQILTDLPQGPWRILGLTVMTPDATAVAADFSGVSLAMRDPDSQRETLLWGWNNATLVNFRYSVDSTIGVAAHATFIPTAVQSNAWSAMGLMPNFCVSSKLTPQQSVSELALRVTTAAFGAGTRDVLANVAIGFALPSVGGIASGLPVPSW